MIEMMSSHADQMMESQASHLVPPFVHCATLSAMRATVETMYRIIEGRRRGDDGRLDAKFFDEHPLFATRTRAFGAMQPEGCPSYMQQHIVEKLRNAILVGGCMKPGFEDC